MFKVSTTIVLGAGASWSYGYPLGSELIDEIIALAKPSTNKNDYGFTSEHSLSMELYRSLSFYDPLSIDSFLTHYRDNEELISDAKRLIARVILTPGGRDFFERGVNLKKYGLSKDDSNTNWYRFLWDAIVSEQSPQELADPKNELNFDVITFNYDSSLEYYFHRCVHSEYSMFDENQKYVVLKKLYSRIHHVYGSVLSHPVSGGTDDPNRLNYDDCSGRELDALIEKCHDRIRLIDEREAGDYKKIQDLISASPHVVFLGFGFDDINIGPKVLNLKHCLQPRKASKSTGLETIPFVKYTNFGDSENVNKTLRNILFRLYDPDYDKAPYRKVGQSIIKSTKKVFQALEEDFRLNTF